VFGLKNASKNNLNKRFYLVLLPWERVKFPFRPH